MVAYPLLYHWSFPNGSEVTLILVNFKDIDHLISYFSSWLQMLQLASNYPLVTDSINLALFLL